MAMKYIAENNKRGKASVLEFLRSYAGVNFRFYGSTVVASIPAFRALGFAFAIALSFVLTLVASNFTWGEAQSLARSHLSYLMPEGMLSVEALKAYVANFPQAVFGLIGLLLLSAWAYVTAVLLFNRRVIVASRQGLRVQLGPLPWPGAWGEPVSNLQGGVTERNETRKSRNQKTGRVTTTTTTYVEARLRSGEVRVVYEERVHPYEADMERRGRSTDITKELFDILFATGRARSVAALVNHGLRGEALPPDMKLPQSDYSLGDVAGETRFEWGDLGVLLVAAVLGVAVVQEFLPSSSGSDSGYTPETEYSAPELPLAPIDLITLNTVPEQALPAGLMDALGALTPHMTVQQVADALIPMVSEFNPEGYLISNDWDVSDGACFAYQEFGLLSLNKQGSLRIGFARAAYGLIGWMIFPYAHGPELYHWDPLHQRFMGSFSGLRDDASLMHNEAIAAEAQAFYAGVHQDLRAGEEARVRRVTDPYSLKRMAEVPQLDREFVDDIKQMAAAPETYEVVCEQRRYSTYEVRLMVRGDWQGSDGRLYPMMGRVVLNKLHNGSELSQEGEGEWTLRGLTWGPVDLP